MMVTLTLTRTMPMVTMTMTTIMTTIVTTPSTTHGVRQPPQRRGCRRVSTTRPKGSFVRATPVCARGVGGATATPPPPPLRVAMIDPSRCVLAKPRGRRRADCSSRLGRFAGVRAASVTWPAMHRAAEPKPSQSAMEVPFAGTAQAQALGKGARLQAKGD